MLFDDRKYPFHLMIRDLFITGGLDAFFKTFHSLFTNNTGEDSQEQAVGPNAEFLDSWLSLLEKLVNPKLILETPHTMSSKPDSNCAPFDPIQYLIYMHKRAFGAINYLWDMPCKKSDQTSDHILVISNHLLRGEAIISEHLKRENQKHSTTVAEPAQDTSSTNRPAPSRRPDYPEVNQDHLQQLIDMGFAREAVVDALLQCQTVEQATDFLCSAPQSSRAVTRPTDNSVSAAAPSATQDVDMLAAEESSSSKPPAGADNQTREQTREEPLSGSKIDTFTDNLLSGSLRLIDEHPPTVYKVCDLILTVSQRNGEDWLLHQLEYLLSEILEISKRLLAMTEPLRARDRKSFSDWASQLRNAPEASQAANRVHLYSLLFDEKKITCAHLLHKSGAIDCLIQLLEVGLDLFSLSKECSVEMGNDPSSLASQTPKWLAHLILLLDLYEKGAIASHRKAPLLNNQRRTWLYFDERTGRWSAHMPINNDIIDKAYRNGEQYVRYSVGRKHYLTQFERMLQINEDSSTLRPIMMKLSPVPPNEIVTKEEDLVPIVPRLLEHQSKTLVRVCVGFMQLPIDPNSLQAAMRLTFRLTRNYELAVLFAELGGVRALQSLPESSQFTGFVSLATMIIRHVLEEPAVLQQTMEKVIRSATQHCQHNQREMHYLLRVLGALACRDEDVFQKLSTEILRITPSTSNRREDEDIRTKPEYPQLLKLLPPKQQSDPIKPSPVTRCVVADLLDSLTIPVQDRSHESGGNIRFGMSSPGPAQERLPTCDPSLAPRSGPGFTAGLHHRNSHSKSSTNADSDKQGGIELSSSNPSQKRQNLLLNHSIVLRLLAELTRSYSVVPKIIVEHTFTPSTNESIYEEISALAFILDNILPATQIHSDRDGPPLARVFLASLAACNHCVEAQIAVVNEVKASLNRAAVMPENCEKHARLQALAGIIGTMIDCCPAITPQNTNPRHGNSANQQLSNNIVRLFVRKGLVTDLARIPHSLDLSAPHMFATVNAILKPLETLSRFVNLPSQSSSTKNHSTPAKKASIESSSSSSSGDDEDVTENNGEEVSAVDDREEDAEDDEDDDDEDDEEEEHVEDDEDHVDDDEDHVDDDEDHVDEDEEHVDDEAVDDDEILNAFGDSNYAEDMPLYNGNLNSVINDIEEVFLQQSNGPYTERLNTISIPGMYDGPVDQHESSAPSLPPPPGNVGLHHPLLLRRLDHHIQNHNHVQTSGGPPVITRPLRYVRPRLLRGTPGTSGVQWQARYPSQTILQQLLGPNTVQEFMTLSNQISSVPGRIFVTDFQNVLAEDELYADHNDPHSLNSPHATALSSIPSVMARWTEESRILDGGTLHDCLTNIKQAIVETLEKFEEAENQERHDKRKKANGEDDQGQQKRTKEPIAPQVSAEQQTDGLSSQNLASSVCDSEPLTQPADNSDRSAPSQPVLSDIVETEASTDQNTNQFEDPITIQQLTQQSQASQQSSGQTSDTNPPPPDSQPGESAASEECPVNDTNMSTQATGDANGQSCELTQGTQSGSLPSETTTSQEQADNATQSAPTARQDPSQASTDTEMIPEGVDPSFLAALPEDIRREVLAEQWRLRRLEQANANRQTSANNEPPLSEQASTSGGGPSTFPEVNPEFLAALPAEVQEEVLAQQRAEQQRQAAANSNPDQPVDPAIFIQTLPPNLRRQVLADIDDSLLSLLPQDLAAEAMLLRREYMNLSANANSTLSRLLRTAAAGRMQRARYTIAVPDQFHNPSSWNWAMERTSGSLAHGNSSNRNLLAPRDPKFKGRQLLDCEALTCLIILLFVQDQRLNVARLHRVLRNLSYHQQTRQWIVQSMLSIIERSRQDDSSRNQSLIADSASSGPAKKDSHDINNSSSWLSISMDAALGCKASVFALKSLNQQVSPAPYVGRDICIHSQAAPAVCRHMLETLIALAKSFPQHFFPEALQSSDDTKDDSESGGSTGLGPDFFEILARLETYLSNANRKARPSVKHSSDIETSFDSPLARLMSFLAHPIIRRSPTLTDRLLHLLAVISIAFPVSPDSPGQYEPWASSGQHRMAPRRTHPNPLYHSRQTAPRPAPPASSVQPGPVVTEYSGGQTKPPSGQKSKPLVSRECLKLAADVLTSKSCSEEGLDDVTSLLLRLSRSCASTRDMVLELLMDGARHLGENVCQHISILQRELKNYNINLQAKSAGAVSPKGMVQDRFTSDTVVIQAPSGSKAGREVQLPSMASLTSKNSSQAFFLRIIRVILQLRATTTQPSSSQQQQQQQSTSTSTSSAVAASSSASTAAAPTTTAASTPALTQDPPQPSQSLAQSDMDVDQPAPTKQEESLSTELQLDNLWDTLSECLLELADTPDHHAVLVLQPAVETFFLVHSPGSQQKSGNLNDDHSSTKNNQTSHIDQEVLPISPSDQKQSETQGTTQKFLKFAETHRVVLNHILRQSSTPLSQGPFAVLVDHTRVLDFDVKRRYFRQELERLDEGIRRDDLGIHVRRDNVFEESFRELHRRSAEEWKFRFFVVFEEEEGQDAGGLLREWYTIISREIFNPMYALFTTSPGDRVTYMINSASHCNTNHLTYFKFVGRVIAKAIYDNKLLDCYFTRSFYKHILGKSVKYTDMESEDYSFYQGLVFLLEHDVKELGYELTFSVEVREFGVTEVRELKPNGANIPVTEENKHEYVRLVCQEKMTGSIRKQLNAFLEGFYDIIPKRLISIFNEQELELLISGLPNIDIDDLKANTEYHKYLPNSLQIQWFWRALRSFDQADRAKLLQFVTGTSKVPLQGFASLEGMNGVQKFQIHRDERSTDRLPSAHTCFNQLDLPVYETYDKLRYMLLKAIQECSEGFGLA